MARDKERNIAEEEIWPDVEDRWAGEEEGILNDDFKPVDAISEEEGAGELEEEGETRRWR
jgi:hypothetical protein